MSDERATEIEALKQQVELLKLKAEVKKLTTEAEGPRVQTPEELKERALKAEEHQRDVMFAASHVKPLLKRVK